MAPRFEPQRQLVTTLNTLCGRYLREGETIPNPGTLTPLTPRAAQVMGGGGVPQLGEKSRIKGIGAYMPDGDCPRPSLADEILMPGEGQVKALISIAGNPVSAWPDQLKTIEAMKALELNITIDIKMSATAKLCDYIIAPKLLARTAPTCHAPRRTSGSRSPTPSTQRRVVDPPGLRRDRGVGVLLGPGEAHGTEIVLRRRADAHGHKPTADECARPR